MRLETAAYLQDMTAGTLDMSFFLLGTALPQIKDHYAQFGGKLPARLGKQLEQLASALS